ncbi:MAG: hypothetical protein ACOYOB_05705 [Myxococcota bacterium]
MHDSAQPWLAPLHDVGPWVGLALFVTLLAISLLVTGFVLVRLAPDHFGSHPGPSFAGFSRPVRLALLVGKNVLGVAVVTLGVFLALPGVPGQGLLTILLGLLLVDGPGKRRLERWILLRPGVLAGLNRLRSRWKRPPLVLDSPVVGKPP